MNSKTRSLRLSRKLVACYVDGDASQFSRVLSHCKGPEGLGEMKKMTGDKKQILRSILYLALYVQLPLSRILNVYGVRIFGNSLLS